MIDANEKRRRSSGFVNISLWCCHYIDFTYLYLLYVCHSGNLATFLYPQIQYPSPAVTHAIMPTCLKTTAVHFRSLCVNDCSPGTAIPHHLKCLEVAGSGAPQNLSSFNPGPPPVCQLREHDHGDAHSMAVWGQDTVISSELITKLTFLGINAPVCNWWLDFLTKEDPTCAVKYAQVLHLHPTTTLCDESIPLLPLYSLIQYHHHHIITKNKENRKRLFLLNLVLTDCDIIWCEVTHTAPDGAQLTTRTVERHTAWAVHHHGFRVSDLSVVLKLPHMTLWHVPRYLDTRISSMGCAVHHAVQPINTHLPVLRFAVVG